MHQALVSRLRSLLKNTDGAAAVALAVSMPVVIGGFGLGAETGYWYFSQRKVQNSADIAAYSAGVALRSGSGTTVIEQAAALAAEETGYVPGRGTIVTNQPPVSGTFAGDANAVEVVVQEALPRMFSGLFSDGDVPVAGRAVARISDGSQTCVLALDTSAPGAVTFIGNTSTILVGCSVHSNSLASDSVLVTGSAAVQTPCVSASGEVSATAGLLMTTCTAPLERADVIADPYADLLAPGDAPGATPITDRPCKAQTTFGGQSGAVYNITPGRYCGGMKVQRTVNMAPGTYIVDGGDLDIGSTASIAGNGVTFYLTNGATIRMNGTSNATLSAPTSGDMAGVLVFVDRNEGYNSHVINGDSSSTVNGAIYAGPSHVDMLGGSTAGGGCTQVVARTIKFSGNSGVGVDCTGTGVRDIRSSRIVSLVE